ncbi:hypothetical protein ACJ6WF_41170 [Streptomyces sp. MMS24-I2-30]|uniref:hypothetical protein n=1 Tax=Streptomyces sp. MMS24-I2-30 TaxID=3351564 RepID=UPI0038969234
MPGSALAKRGQPPPPGRRFFAAASLLQDILSEEKWQKRLTDADRRALSPLLWTHVNPYGRLELDMTSHLALAATASMVPGPRPAPDTRTGEPAAEGTAGSAS